MPVPLSAGDGIVYLTPILHWGSNYGNQHRRTLHFDYRAFNNGSLTHAYVRHWQPKLADNLPALEANRFLNFLSFWKKELKQIECAFRSMINNDSTSFVEVLSKLHSGKTGHTCSLIQLSKIAKTVRARRHPFIEKFSEEGVDLVPGY